MELNGAVRLDFVDDSEPLLISTCCSIHLVSLKQVLDALHIEEAQMDKRETGFEHYHADYMMGQLIQGFPKHAQIPLLSLIQTKARVRISGSHENTGWRKGFFALFGADSIHQIDSLERNPSFEELIPLCGDYTVDIDPLTPLVILIRSEYGANERLVELRVKTKFLRDRWLLAFDFINHVENRPTPLQTRGRERVLSLESLDIHSEVREHPTIVADKFFEFVYKHIRSDTTTLFSVNEYNSHHFKVATQKKALMQREDSLKIIDLVLEDHVKLIKLMGWAMSNSFILSKDDNTITAQSFIQFSSERFEEEMISIGKFSVVDGARILGLGTHPELQISDEQWREALKSNSIAKSLMQTSVVVEELFSSGRVTEAKDLSFQSNKAILKNMILASYCAEHILEITKGELDYFEWRSLLSRFSSGNNRVVMATMDIKTFLVNPSIHHFHAFFSSQTCQETSGILCTPLQWIHIWRFFLLERIQSARNVVTVIADFLEDEPHCSEKTREACNHILRVANSEMEELAKLERVLPDPLHESHHTKTNPSVKKSLPEEHLNEATQIHSEVTKWLDVAIFNPRFYSEIISITAKIDRIRTLVKEIERSSCPENYSPHVLEARLSEVENQVVNLQNWYKEARPAWNAAMASTDPDTVRQTAKEFQHVWDAPMKYWQTLDTQTQEKFSSAGLWMDILALQADVEASTIEIPAQ